MVVSNRRSTKHSRCDSLAARAEQGTALLEGLLVAQTLLESAKALVLSRAVPVAGSADAAVLILVASECSFDSAIYNSSDLLTKGVDQHLGSSMSTVAGGHGFTRVLLVLSIDGGAARAVLGVAEVVEVAASVGATGAFAANAVLHGERRGDYAA